jgi:hypothetical protein
MKDFIWCFTHCSLEWKIEIVSFALMQLGFTILEIYILYFIYINY